MHVFVDTSVWYAALDRSDKSHERASDVLRRPEDWLLSDHVLVEVHRLAGHRLGLEVADRFLTTVLGGSAEVELVSRSDLEAAARIRGQFADQRYSLIDCTSFALMERLRIHDVATFDIDFSVYRFGPRLGQAFRVLG